MKVIRFENVSKRYRIGQSGSLRDTLTAIPARLLSKTKDSQNDLQNLWALKDVDFGIEQGEVVGFIGANGAGKTTTLKLLSRVTIPTSGQVVVDGRTSALIELGAGFHPDLTGRENIYLNGSILGLKKKEIDAKFDEIVDFAELERFIDTPVKRYSSGMYARLGFSVAAFTDPDVLLVDEVLSVGDIMFQQKCFKKMQEFKSNSKTIVFVSHNLNSIQEICTRVIWLDKGQVRIDGAPQEVVSQFLKGQFSRSSAESKPTDEGVPLRYGTGDAEIRAVRILKQDGQPGEAFEVDEPVRVEIDYHAQRHIEPVNILIAITNEKGTKLGAVDFVTANYTGLPSIQDSGTVQCHLESLPLRAGIYFLVVIISQDGMVLDRQGMIGPLVIKEDQYLSPNGYGFMNLRAKWSAVEPIVSDLTFI